MTVLVIMLMTGTGLAKRDIISPNLHGYENRLSSLQSPDKPSHIDRCSHMKRCGSRRISKHSSASISSRLKSGYNSYGQSGF